MLLFSIPLQNNNLQKWFSFQELIEQYKLR